MLQFFSASTNIVNSKRAITECLENALQGEPDLNCDLIIIYSAMGHNFKDLLSEARRLSPGSRIAGCTCAGVIGKNGPDESMTALNIMAIKGPANEFAITHRSDLTSNDPYLTASIMAQELKDMNPYINFIQFLPSWVGWDPHDITAEGIKKIFGKNIPISGGVSSDNSKGITSFHFFDDQVVEKGAVMIGFADTTLKIISHASCGFRVIEGMQFEVTRSEGNRIYELNHKPAWQQYTSTLGLPETIHYVEAFIVASFAVELPEFLHQEYDSKYILFAPAKNNGDGSFNAGISCPQGTKLYLTRRDERLMFESVDNIVNKTLNELDGRMPVAVFHADCALRGKLSLNRILKDELINRIQSPIRKNENVPWLGFYGGGEYAMLGGETRFHQFSSAVTVLYR